MKNLKFDEVEVLHIDKEKINDSHTINLIVDGVKVEGRLFVDYIEEV
jgi:hypothetical protein